MLSKYPLPGLVGVPHTVDLEKDFDRRFHELDEEDLLNSSIDNVPDSPVKQKKRSKSAKKQGSKQSKKGKSKRKNQPKERKKEADDCRPDSDKDDFSSLHKAKHKQRLAHQSGQTMPKKAVHKAVSNQENVEPRARGEPRSPNGQNPPAASHPLSSLPMEMQERYKQQLKDINELDLLLGTKDLRMTLARARKTQLHLKFNNEILLACKVNNVKLDKENAGLRKENAELREQLDIRTSKSKARVMRESEGEKKNIVDKMPEIWRAFKFITCKEEEDETAEYTYKLIYGEDNVDLDKMYSWCETYKKTIRENLYAKRNYVASRIKDCAWKIFESGQTLPSLEMIRKCIGRKIDVENEDEMRIFKWYWEDLLPKVVGASEWGPAVRYYNTITLYMIPNEPKKRVLITPNDEAMICVLWDNQYDKWHELWEFAKDPTKKGQKQVNRGGKYTSCEKGYCTYSGWDDGGIKSFNMYENEAKDGRKGPNRKLLERTTLNQLRVQRNIDQPDHATQLKVNRGRKRKNLPNDAPISATQNRLVRTKRFVEEPIIMDDEDE